MPSNSTTMIDGSYGEGGGQLLRNAAAYAAIFRKNIYVFNIRARRAKPGLKRQHLIGLQLLAEACGGCLEGDSLGSTEIVFNAKKTNEDRCKTMLGEKILTGDTKTAGSICLLLQAVIPYALFNPGNTWVLKGGTNATMAPQFDYCEHIFLPTIYERLKLPEDVLQPKVFRRGYFPKGGGEVQFTSTLNLLKPLPPITLTERGEISNIWIRSFYAGKFPRSVAKQMGEAAEIHVKNQIPNASISKSVVYDNPAVGNGSGILLVATTTTGCRFGGSALCSPKSHPDDVGIKAATELCNAVSEGGCVDDYLQDQLILYMALSSGTSEIVTGSLTLHTQTAIWVAEQLCPARFDVTKLNGDASPQDSEGRVAGRHRIRCEGIGFLGDS